MPDTPQITHVGSSRALPCVPSLDYCPMGVPAWHKAAASSRLRFCWDLGGGGGVGGWGGEVCAEGEAGRGHAGG